MNTQKINRKHCIIVFILLLAYFLFVRGSNVYAQDNNIASVTLPVQQIFEAINGDKVDSKFYYRLIPLEPENPMPNGSTDNGYVFSLEGNENINTEPISFSSTGIYTYQMEQVIENKNSGYIYDEQVYHITIYINKTSEGLSAQVIVKNSNDYKVDVLEFTNAYDNSRDSDPSTPNSYNKSRGSDSSKSQNVKTGDFVNFAFWFLIFTLASSLVLITTKKKNKSNK